jgi:hypothetical protein
MITNKQKFFLFLAWVVLAASFLNTTAVMKFSQDTGSRLAINVGFVVMFFSISSGLLVSALIAIRAFRKRPLVPELPLWLKLVDYYAIFMVAWGMFVLVFSGETPEEQAARWQLEQVSNLTLIHAGMVVIGLTYYGCLWLIAYHRAKSSRGINA